MDTRHGLSVLGPVVVAATLLAVLGQPGCSEPSRQDDGGHDADGDADADGDPSPDADGDGADADEDADAGGPPRPGPLVLAAQSVSVSAERRCDVDGNGTLDNAVAELGATGSAMLVLAMNAAISSGAEPWEHLVIHIRAVDDLGGPSLSDGVYAVYSGLDADDPVDPSDDLSGSEPLYTGRSELDRNGEPEYVGAALHIDAGEISGGRGDFPFPLGETTSVLAVHRVGGRIEPHGVAFDTWICGSLPSREVGGVEVGLMGASELTLLEVLLLGGAAFGMDTVPGLRPDVDIDGDGLETYDTDDAGRIVRCVDGDRSVIDGRECWRDERMADAFSLTVEVRGVGARWAGREPGWEYSVPAGGTPPPRGESFFSTMPPSDAPCVGLDQPCDPLSPAPCCDPSHRCSGADFAGYRCAAPCEPSPCSYGDLVGTCLVGGPIAVSHCAPVSLVYGRVDCVHGSDGCTTAYGVSGDTTCYADSEGGYCVERCSPPVALCGPERWCVPRAFEPGGDCVFLREL